MSRHELEAHLPGGPTVRHPIPPDAPLTLGRSSQCDLVLDGEGVKRFHARIVAGENGCRLVGVEGPVHVDGVLHTADAAGREIPLPDKCELRIGAIDGPLLRLYRMAGSATTTTIRKRSPVLVCRKLTIGTALVDVDLEVLSGEVVVILGMSGSGKTTLLKCLARLLAESGGTIESPAPESAEQSEVPIAFVGQEDSLPPELTPEQVLHYAARLQSGPGRRIDRARIDEVVRDMEIGAFARRPVRTLSGGQRRRVSIALALVGSPRLLILDEPESGLDPHHSQRLMETLRNLADRRRIGIVLSTHSLLHQNLMDRVVVLHRGTVRDAGRPSDVAARFGIDDLHRIYRRLEAEGGEGDATARSVRTFGRPRRGRAALRPSPGRFLALLERGFLRKIATRSRLAATVALPVAVAASMRLVWATWPAGGLAPDVALLPLLGFVAAIWLGMTAAVSEIIGEKALYFHERVLGVRDLEYVGAKIGVVATLVLGQVLVLGAILAHETTLDAGFLGAGLAVAGLSGAALGLAVSSLAPTTGFALRMVPVLVIPQILFSKMTGFPIEERTPAFVSDVLAPFVFTTHVEAIFADPDALEGGWSALSPDVDLHGALGQLAGLVLALIGLVFVGLVLRQRRERRSRVRG